MQIDDPRDPDHQDVVRYKQTSGGSHEGEIYSLLNNSLVTCLVGTE